METDLKSWLITYIKHRNINTKSIVSIDDAKKGLVVVKYVDKEVFYPLKETLEDFVFLKNFEGKHIDLVVLNKVANLKILLKNWEELSQKTGLKVIFVNPYSKSDKRWIIIPYIHNRISDKKTLSVGLKTLFESVEVVP